MPSMEQQPTKSPTAERALNLRDRTQRGLGIAAALLTLGTLAGCDTSSYVKLSDNVVEKGPLRLDCDGRPTGHNRMVIHGLDSVPWAVNVGFRKDNFGVSEDNKGRFAVDKDGFKKNQEVSPSQYDKPGTNSIVSSPMDVRVTANPQTDVVGMDCLDEHGAVQPSAAVFQIDIAPLLKQLATSPSPAR